MVEQTASPDTKAAYEGRLPAQNWGWFLVRGILSLLLGLAIPVATAMAPGESILSVGWIIGVFAIASGITLIMLALRLRSSKPLGG